MVKKIVLGKSGLEVSRVCYGSWQLSPKFWGEQPEEKHISAMRRAYEVGVNFYDTADAYGNGLSETVMGKALKPLPRDKIVVATKVFHHFYPDGRRHGDLSGTYIVQECEASLKRLQMDYVDLYQCHSFDPMTPLEETTEALDKLKKEGKIRAYGVSNFTVEQLRTIIGVGNYSTLQPRYNLLQKEAEDDLLPLCKSENIGVLTYSSLRNGLLTGKYAGDETFSDFRKNIPDFKGDRFKELAGRVRDLKPIAERYEATIVQLVLAAALMNPAVHCVIAGIKEPAHIEDAAGAADLEISREDYFEIRKIIGS